MPSSHAIILKTEFFEAVFRKKVTPVKNHGMAHQAFDFLKTPIKRIALQPCPCPVSKPLEDAFYPTFHQIIKAAHDLLNRQVLRDVKMLREIDTFIGPY